MNEILEILEKDARTTPEEIAGMLNMTPGAVKNAIKKLEKDGIILKYKAIINREIAREEESGVRALIEVRITPEKNLGFEHIAESAKITALEIRCGTFEMNVDQFADKLGARQFHADFEFEIDLFIFFRTTQTVYT